MLISKDRERLTEDEDGALKAGTQGSPLFRASQAKPFPCRARSCKTNSEADGIATPSCLVSRDMAHRHHVYIYDTVSFPFSFDHIEPGNPLSLAFFSSAFSTHLSVTRPLKYPKAIGPNRSFTRHLFHPTYGRCGGRGPPSQPPSRLCPAAPFHYSQATVRSWPGRRTHRHTPDVPPHRIPSVLRKVPLPLPQPEERRPPIRPPTKPNHLP
ncbi:hypothetical protein CGCVW01_v001995 [Colletotrichum viniferum]|nr:hypothetical protein CGCVW01_v001995 [Colletotrichum viniferum]